MDEDLRTFGDIIGLIYDAAADLDRWRDVLAAVADQLDAINSLVIIAPDSANREGLTFVLGSSQYLQLNHFAEGFPVLAPFATIAPRSVASIADLMSWEDWEASPFFREVAGPTGIGDVLSIEIHLDDRSVYRLRFCRKYGAPLFDEGNKHFANLLVPHLRRAFEMSREIAYRKMVHHCYVDACNRLGLAAFVVDKRGALLERNEAANALLEGDNGLAVRQDRLVATDDRENRAFQRAVSKVLEPGGTEGAQILAVAREGRMSLGVAVQPIVDAEVMRAGVNRPAAIIFVRDPDGRMSDTRAAQLLFDLTPAEAALLMRLANGHSLQEAAEDMNVRPSTVRTHLRAIFAKTGTARQSALIRQVLNSVTAFAEPPPSH